MIKVIINSVFPVILLLSTSAIFISCTASNAISIEVHKSAFLPDCEELLVDSLLADGVKICSIAQRYFHKSMSLGGGGNSFEGFAIPVHYDTTDYGTFVAKMSKMQYHLTGIALPGICDTDHDMMIEFTVSPEHIVANVSYFGQN